ncbi:hypothetical protein SXANM310S_03930 [Streptomyces xanthochromogenes]
MARAIGTVSIQMRDQARARPTAAAPAMVAWFEGKDQSPLAGQAISEVAAPATARQGRSSSINDLATSLHR